MSQGTVKWYSEKKGYGFITDDQKDVDVFVHYKNIIGRPLQKGDVVTYDIQEGSRGPFAKNVKQVPKPA